LFGRCVTLLLTEDIFYFGDYYLLDLRIDYLVSGVFIEKVYDAGGVFSSISELILLKIIITWRGNNQRCLVF